MRLRKFDNVESAVRDYGSEEANEELKWRLKLTRTNFAACYGTGTQGPDAHDSAIDRLYARVPAIEGGGGELISRICDWMYAQAKEKCTCRAPSFITGCDHMAETGDNHVAECTCQTDECPWTHHTGVFL